MTTLRALSRAQERKKMREMNVRRISVLFLLLSFLFLLLEGQLAISLSLEMWKALATMM
jgi:hypothetical protein